MEKLLELLNEYGKGSFELEIDNDTGELTGGIVDANQDTFEVTSYYITMQIISKRFGFIKRLFKENKIDIERLHEIVDYRLEIKENYVNAHDYNSDCLLMLLSISNTPIEDLISYLKE